MSGRRALVALSVALLLGLSQVASAAPTEVKLWTSAEALADPLVERYIKEFEAAHPNVKIQWTTFPWYELRTKVLAAFAAGTGPDIIQIDTPWIPEFVEAGMLDVAPAEVQADLQANFLPVGRYLVTYKGNVYGYPWWAFTNALIFNQTLFTQAGLNPSSPPRTWEELRVAARKLTRTSAGKLQRAGFLINQRLLHLTDYLYNNGAAVIGEDERGVPKEPVKSTFNDPKVVETLTFLSNLYQVDKVGSSQFTNNMYEAFQRGEVAMLIEAQWLIPWTLSAAPDLKFGLAPLPTPSGKPPVVRVDAYIMGVSRKSPPQVRALAWKFLQEKISTSQVDMLNSALSAPTRMDASSAGLKSDDWIKRFYAAYVERASRTKPWHRAWEEIERRVEPILARMYLGEISPEETARLSHGEINAALQGF